MGHVAMAPWDMLRGYHGTCCEGSMGHFTTLSQLQGSTVYFDFSLSNG